MKPAGMVVCIFAFFASSCADMVMTVSNTYSVGAYEDFLYQAAKGDVWTVVSGNPFSAPRADLERAVVGAMQGANWGPPARFAIAPSGSSRYKVVMAFDPPRAATADAICGGGPMALPATFEGRTRLVAVFCRNGVALKEISGTFARPSGPDDRRLAQFVRQEIVELFQPEQDPLVPDTCDPPTSC